MTRILSSRMFCVTMFLLFALALMANSFAGGTLPTFGANPVFAPHSSGQVADADSPIFPPDPYDRDTQGNPPQRADADSPIFPPDPYDRGTEGNPPQRVRG